MVQNGIGNGPKTLIDAFRFGYKELQLKRSHDDPKSAHLHGSWLHSGEQRTINVSQRTLPCHERTIKLPLEYHFRHEWHVNGLSMVHLWYPNGTLMVHSCSLGYVSGTLTRTTRTLIRRSRDKGCPHDNPPKHQTKTQHSMSSLKSWTLSTLTDHPYIQAFRGQAEKVNACLQ